MVKKEKNKPTFSYLRLRAALKQSLLVCRKGRLVIEKCLADKGSWFQKHLRRTRPLHKQLATTRRRTTFNPSRYHPVQGIQL